MRLENLIAEIVEEMYKKITENRTVEESGSAADGEDGGNVCDQVRRSVQPGVQRLYL